MTVIRFPSRTKNHSASALPSPSSRRAGPAGELVIHDARDLAVGDEIMFLRRHARPGVTRVKLNGEHFEPRTALITALGLSRSGHRPIATYRLDDGVEASTSVDALTRNGCWRRPRPGEGSPTARTA